MTRLFCALLLALFPLAVPVRAFTPNAEEIAVANLAKAHPNQQRPTMVYDSILSMVARYRAQDLGRRAYFAHVDPDGYAANKDVQLVGYVLPASYGTANATNSIESVGAGCTTPQEAFNGWVADPPHRQHVLGEIAFYAQQTRYGMGYANVPGSPYTHYWVFITAPPNPNGDNRLEPYAEWLYSYFRPIQIDTNNDASDADNDRIGRIVEFAFTLDPTRPSTLPAPTRSAAANRLEWRPGIRSDLGSVIAEVQRSNTLTSTSWTTAGVTNTAGVDSIPLSARSDYMRLRVQKP